MDTIGFLGSGNMAEALIKGIITASLYTPDNICISDIRPTRCEHLAAEYGIRTTDHNRVLSKNVDILMLCVKPQIMTAALESIDTALRKDQLVISIAAGIKVADIEAVLGDVAVVRVMPNTPALIGQGAAALFANEKAKPHLEKVLSIFSSVGKAVVVDNEDLIDAVTAVSGSGPAYYFLLMEEMTKAAIDLGLPEEIAKDLVIQTAKGAALLAAEADKNNESPAQLREKVTSPGGTTEAALKVFAEGEFGPLVLAALKRARDRSRELSA